MTVVTIAAAGVGGSSYDAGAVAIEIPKRADVIRDHKAAGGGVAAVYPIHYPRGLFRAFDLLPVEVWGPPRRDTSSGDAHVQAYACSIVRCGMSFLLDGGLDDVDVICVPHACDSLQGLGSVMIDFVKPKQPVLTLYLPRARRRIDREFITEEVRALYQKLAEHTGKQPSESRLLEAVEREEKADRALGQLLAERRGIDASDREFYSLVRSREFLPAERFIELAERAMASENGSPKKGVPLLLSGLVPEPMKVFDALEEAGAVVVADDMACAGRRLYPPGKSSDPFQRMAESLDGGPPDPTRGASVAERIEFLVKLAGERDARGVLFFDVKFCEPEQFYMPLTRKGLMEAGLRSLSVEVDIADELPNQVATRLEAFVETLS